MLCNADGSLDTTFGTDGTVSTDLGAKINTAGEDIAVEEPDGSIMVATGADGDLSWLAMSPVRSGSGSSRT